MIMIPQNRGQPIMDFRVIFGNLELFVIFKYIQVYQMANKGIYPLKRE